MPKEKAQAQSNQANDTNPKEPTQAEIKASEAQTLQDVHTQTPAEAQDGVKQEGNIVQVAATYSTMNNANMGSNKISEAEMKRDVEAAAKVLKDSSTKSITIPKQMAPILGETLISCINGACIRIPVDGESYDIPEPYYKVIQESLKTIHAGDVRDEYGFGSKVGDDALLSK